MQCLVMYNINGGEIKINIHKSLRWFYVICWDLNFERYEFSDAMLWFTE